MTTTTQSPLLLIRLFFLVSALVAVEGYTFVSMPPSFQTRQMDLSMKRGRGSFKKEVSSSSSSGMSSRGSGMASAGTTNSINWCPMPPNQKLPKEQGKVGLLDTQLPTLKKQATNPTGAVGVVTHKDETFCFSASCPSCQVPLTKAKVVDTVSSGDDASTPKLVCDFCKATYSLKENGAKVESVESGGLFGGVVKSIFASQQSGDLPMYKLGERNGKLVIAVD